MSVMRHWLVLGKGDEDETFVVWDEEALHGYRIHGYRIDGPFVLEADAAQGAVEALRAADRLADAITLHCDRDDVLDFAAKYEKARTPTREQS